MRSVIACTASISRHLNVESQPCENIVDLCSVTTTYNTHTVYPININSNQFKSKQIQPPKMAKKQKETGTRAQGPKMDRKHIDNKRGLE